MEVLFGLADSKEELLKARYKKREECGHLRRGLCLRVEIIFAVVETISIVQVL